MKHERNKLLCLLISAVALISSACEDPDSSASLPEAPPSLSVDAGYNRLRVSWNGAEDADTYEVWYGRNDSAGEAERFAGETSGGSIVIPNLENGVDYYIKARPKNANGTGPWSEVVRDTPLDTKGVPQNLAVEAGDGSLNLSWEPLWDAASYEVFYSDPNANLEIFDKVKCAEEPEEGKITINLDDYLYRYHVWVRAKYDDGSTGDYSDSGEGKIYKVINTELYDMGYFLERQTSVVQDNPDNPYKIVLTDFYSSIRELEKLAVYTKGKYVDLDMGGLTNLWITVLAPEAENRDRFVSIVFPGDIENIPNNCCDRMRNLRSIILPPGLVQIGERAFWECTRLENFTLPPGVTTIGEDAFWNCDRLTTVDLTNVTSIGTSAFYQCDSLQVAIVDKNEPPSMGSYVFGYWAASLSNDFAIYVPDESIEAYQTAPNWNFYHDVSGNTFDGTIINGWDVLRGRASAYIYQSRFKPLSELPEEYR